MPLPLIVINIPSLIVCFHFVHIMRFRGYNPRNFPEITYTLVGEFKRIFKRIALSNAYATFRACYIFLFQVNVAECIRLYIALKINLKCQVDRGLYVHILDITQYI
jgi:hypothetical protein